jgi:anti-anti-sigma factor
MDNFSIQSETRTGVAVVTVSGRIDSENAPAFDTELTKVVVRNSKLVLNLENLDYMSSAGIRALVKASQGAERDGGAVRLASVPESVNSILYTVGLNQKIGSFASVDEAVGSF